jgi:hypothetical protein
MAESSPVQLGPVRATPPCALCTRDPETPFVTTKPTTACRHCGVAYYCGKTCAIRDAAHHAHTCRWLQTLGPVAAELRRVFEATGLFLASDGTWRCVPFCLHTPPGLLGALMRLVVSQQHALLRGASQTVPETVRTTLQQPGIGFRECEAGAYGLVQPHAAERIVRFAAEHGYRRVVVPAAGSALLPRLLQLFAPTTELRYECSDTTLCHKAWMPVARADARTHDLYGPDALVLVSWPVVPDKEDYASALFVVLAEQGVRHVLLLHEARGLSSMPETAYDALERHYEPDPALEIETFLVDDMGTAFETEEERAAAVQLMGVAAVHALQATTLYRLRSAEL